LTDSNAVMAWTASDYYSIINAMLYWLLFKTNSALRSARRPSVIPMKKYQN